MKVRYKKPKGQRIKKAYPILIRGRKAYRSLVIEVIRNGDYSLPHWYSHDYKTWILDEDLSDYLKETLDESVSNGVWFEAEIWSLKAAKRFIARTPHPKGTKFRVLLPWQAHVIIVTK